MNPTTLFLMVLAVVCFGCILLIIRADSTRRRMTEQINVDARRKTLERKRELLLDFLDVPKGYIDRLFQGGLVLEQREQMASELTDWVATKGSYFLNAPYRIHDELVALANYASALALPDQRVDETILKTGLL